MPLRATRPRDNWIKTVNPVKKRRLSAPALFYCASTGRIEDVVLCRLAALNPCTEGEIIESAGPAYNFDCRRVRGNSSLGWAKGIRLLPTLLNCSDQRKILPCAETSPETCAFGTPQSCRRQDLSCSTRHRAKILTLDTAEKLHFARSRQPQPI